MSSNSKVRVSDYLVRCPDLIEVENISFDEMNSSRVDDTRNSPPNNTIQHESTQFYYDSSTLTSTAISDSTFESSTDYKDFDRRLAMKTSSFSQLNLSDLINGSNDKLGTSVFVERSKDVNVGQTVINGNLVLRPRRDILERFFNNISSKDEFSYQHRSQFGNRLSVL